ncbi:hypothetical protein L596_007350 [Steinernema carpocapsae]|uniref:C3H1-type domain-containing protein n=1 Tax=Steinernema carpocapsae TaxID=34508 RepID=A0A4U5P954_STECR|nr:hypothetical protein L596_007350 [Steinernema carpocapsae]
MTPLCRASERRTVLLRNFYQSVEPFFTPQLLATPDGTREFEAFYWEVFTEIEKEYGKIEELNVCENIGEHLIGNVYIKFAESFSANKAVKDLNRRWFARQPIYAELSPVVDFRDACCRQHEIGECNRGGFCNFMHIKQPSSQVLREIRNERAPRKRRWRSASLSSLSALGSSSGSDSDSSAALSLSSCPSVSDSEDDSDLLPKNYRLQYTSDSEDASDSNVSKTSECFRQENERIDSEPNSTTPKAFRAAADNSSDDGEMSESEREMVQRRKQRLFVNNSNQQLKLHFLRPPSTLK